MEYKVSSFDFDGDFTRDQKHFIIMRINSFRSKCPSDAMFSGGFKWSGNEYTGQLRVLFSKGEFLASGRGANCQALMESIETEIWQQIELWRETRFSQEQTFVNFQVKKGS